MTKITAKVDADAVFVDLGKGNAVQAARLMRRLLEINCTSCFDAVANPNPGFTVRMFYSPDEKAGAESVETNNMEALKTANGITDPHFFKWFKASGKTAQEVVAGLTINGIAATGEEWADGTLAAGIADGVDYVDFPGINSFSTFGGVWVVNINIVLPIKWLDVQAVPSGKDAIKIKWITASEINNAGFVVERSQNGQHYHPVASVAPQVQNIAGSPSYYSAVDNDVMPGVTYYYRIKQTDIDGRVRYSKIVTIKLGATTVNHLQIYPNPVSRILKWNMYVSRSQLLRATIIDAVGGVLADRKFQAHGGDNNFTINVSMLSSGTYLLKVVDEDGSTTVQKFVVP